MNKVKILLPIALLLLLIPTISADVPVQSSLEIQILTNDGLSQYSIYNYTFNCQKADTNILTIIIKQISGFTYLNVLHFQNGTYIDAGYRQLDKNGNAYNIQFIDEGQYRLRVVNEYNSSEIYQDFYINVIGGTGSFVVGDYNDMMTRGHWVTDLYNEYGAKDWPTFQIWLGTAAKWYSNPAFILTDFLMQVPIFLIMPQVWFIIAIIVAVVIWRYRSRLFHTRQDRELSQVYGNKENLILTKRQAEEKERLHLLNTMPIDYALEKYGSGDYLSRSVMYHMGVPDLGVTYPTAYSLAFELGGNLFAKDPERRKKAENILKGLVVTHEPVLEKAYIYQDIAACAKAVSAESTDPRARLILKDEFMRIHDLALQAARIATEELSSRLKLEGKVETSLGDEILKIEKGGKKGGDKPDKTSNPV